MQPPSSAAMIFASAQGGKAPPPGCWRPAPSWGLAAPSFRSTASTYIRSLLEAGDLDRARRFLGHPHQFTGTVVSGAHLGRTWGIPTANLELPPELLLPPKGVYACRARTPEGTYLAVTNIGTRPTVNGHGLTIEPWLLDYTGDLYGQPVTLELWHFLRGERRFPSLEALQDEIRRNASQTRAFFEK